MEEQIGKGFRATRWLAWAAAGLLVAGAVSAGTVSSANKQTDTRIVTAAGDATGGVEVPTTAASVTAPLAPPPLPTTTVAPAPAPPTTVAKATTTTAAAAKAPAVTTAPATTPPTTTPAVRSATTVPPVTATTATTISGRFTVTIVSQFDDDVDVTINGQVFRVAANQSVGPMDLALASNGNDIVEVRVVSEPTCGEGDAGGYFTAGGRFRLSIVPGGTCGVDGSSIRAPQAKSTPA